MCESLRKSHLRPEKVHVVGTLHCEQEGDLHCARGIDAIEFRLDLLRRLPSQEELGIYQKPFIMTARCAEEGGDRNLGRTERLELLLEALPLASFVDLELRFWDEAAPVVEAAQKAGVGIIGSFHDFVGTPALSELLARSRAAQEAGADVFKVATYLKGPADLACLLQLLAMSPLPLAVMGMGPLGKASRLVFARCGSVFNYGWLVRPFVPGQWSAEKFAERLEELFSST